MAADVVSALPAALLHRSRLVAEPGLACRIVPGKQRALVTTRAYAPGDVMLVEPSVCWQRRPGEVSVGAELRAEDVAGVLLQFAPYCLEIGDGGAVTSAAPDVDASALPLPALEELVSATMRANAFALNLPPEDAAEGAPAAAEDPRALFPLICLANSSCAPNARVQQVEVEGGTSGVPYYLLSARAPIAEGEEVTIAYVPRAWRKAQRQRELLETYGFACDCPRCAVPVDDTLVLRCPRGGCDGRVFLPDSSAAGVAAVAAGAAGDAAASSGEAGSAAAAAAAAAAGGGGGRGSHAAPASRSVQGSCVDCGASLELSSPALRSAGAEVPAGLPPVPPPGGWTPANAVSTLHQLLSHPVLAPDDVRVFTRLNETTAALQELAEGGDAAATEAFGDAAQAIARVALRSRFVTPDDLGLEIETEEEGAGEG